MVPVLAKTRDACIQGAFITEFASSIYQVNGVKQSADCERSTFQGEVQSHLKRHEVES